MGDVLAALPCSKPHNHGHQARGYQCSSSTDISPGHQLGEVEAANFCLVRGCLQDVHWSVGLFGYFPTYSLGNVYAGCLHRALRDAVPALDAQMAGGDTSAATGWLRENLQRHGGLREPRATVEHACGFAPSAEPLLAYLEQKFRAIYRL